MIELKSEERSRVIRRRGTGEERKFQKEGVAYAYTLGQELGGSLGAWQVRGAKTSA